MIEIRAEVLERFTKETAGHVMTVVRADGLHRHVRFRNPTSSTYWFDLITWPGHLCINGDCGTCAFRRVEDMFSFFRSPKMEINPGYWAEKLVAMDKDGFEKFSPEFFRAAVTEHFESHFDGCDDSALKAETWREINDQIFGALEEGEHAACTAVHEFDFKGFTFQDFFEGRIVDYTWSFIWCLYAIVWGISKFDALPAQEAPR